MMRPPRQSDARSRWGSWRHLLVLTCVVGVCATGCFEAGADPEVAMGPYTFDSPLLDAQGTRVLIEDDEGGVVAKWRVRRGGVRKIYDAELVPRGYVRRDVESSEVSVVATSLGHQVRVEVRELAEGQISVGGGLTLEARDGGWLLYDTRRLLLGVARFEDGGAQLLADLAPHRAPEIAVERVGDDVVARRNGQRILRAPEHVAPAALLAYAIDSEELGALERAALAMFFEDVARADHSEDEAPGD